MCIRDSGEPALPRLAAAVEQVAGDGQGGRDIGIVPPQAQRRAVGSIEAVGIDDQLAADGQRNAACLGPFDPVLKDGNGGACLLYTSTS